MADVVVSSGSLEQIITKLSVGPQKLGLDTETTGLKRSDRIFSIIIADETDSYYFNFNKALDIPAELTLTDPRDLSPIFDNPEALFFIHNAKFDMHMLAKEGIYLVGEVHCTLAMERILYNAHKSYKLEACAERRGWEKEKAVDKYIDDNGLSKKVDIPGKDKRETLKFFNQVPFPIITKYGCQDGRLHRALGISQLESFRILELQRLPQSPSILPLIANERKITKTCWRMEDRGIHIDSAYTEKAIEHTNRAIKKATQEYEEMCGVAYSNSSKALQEGFQKFGVVLPLTPKSGKPCTNKAILDKLDNPLAEKIREIRSQEKLVSTYFSSFLYYADNEGFIHPNMNQSGTETGRFSYSNPNLQNVPKEDAPEDLLRPNLVRRCFTPESEAFCFVSIDYDQQEYRMMLDYAGEMEMIKKILEGLDVHEATAQIVGTTRKRAKKLNFGLLYGMGREKLSLALGTSLAEASDLMETYFSRLPRVKTFINQVISRGRRRGYVWNWFGFRNHITASEFAYILPNHIIQGGCAAVVKCAMTQIDEYFISKKARSSMNLQVHDELLFQMHKDELDDIARVQQIMEGIYRPRNGLHLTCSVGHSWKSWADMVKGLGNGLRS